MKGPGAIVAATRWRLAVLRAIGFFALWVILSGGAAVDLLPGLVAALAAAAVSLRLLPPAMVRIRPAALARLVGRLLPQSLIAGVDVACRALDPRLPINPGLVHYPLGLPPGAARNTFTNLMSLLPGTVPIRADARGILVIHCLDAAQPVADQLAVEEALLVHTIGGTSGSG